MSERKVVQKRAGDDGGLADAAAPGGFTALRAGVFGGEFGSDPGSENAAAPVAKPTQHPQRVPTTRIVPGPIAALAGGAAARTISETAPKTPVTPRTVPPDRARDAQHMAAPAVDGRRDVGARRRPEELAPDVPRPRAPVPDRPGRSSDDPALTIRPTAAPDASPPPSAPATPYAPPEPIVAALHAGERPTPALERPVPARLEAKRHVREPATPERASKLEKDSRHGHRERLRARLREAGPKALAEYELLEMVLFRALPRQDTKPLAKRLLKTFGSFADTINARDARLAEVPGVGDAVIAEFRLMAAVADTVLRGAIADKPVLSSWEAVLDYVRAHIGFAEIEHFHVLFLDKKNRLIRDEIQQRGTVDHTPVYPREVVRRALELNATALILVHNHPSGDTTPSRADVEMTRTIVETARPLNIAVHDHVIVGRAGHASLKGLGLI